MVVSQNGYVAGDKSVIYNPTVPGTKILLPGGLRRGPTGELLLYVAAQLHARVENGADGYGMWGYAYRPIRGFVLAAMAADPLDELTAIHTANRACCYDNEDTLMAASALSNHSSGTAFDWHAPKHPLGKKGTYSSAQVATIRAICNVECEGAVRWGGDYVGRVDEMHYEITKDEATCQRVLNKLRGLSSSSVSQQVPMSRLLKFSPSQLMVGEDVKNLQRVLNAWYKVARPVWWPLVVSGQFDASTDAAVRFMQSKAGLVSDGVVGPATRKALGL